MSTVIDPEPTQTPAACPPRRCTLLRSAWADALILGSYCSFLFFYGLSAGEFYRTENLRATIAAEFLQSGNWLVPRLYGEPLFTKPPGAYLAIALASWPAGHVQEWTARLPSALAATVTVLLFYWYFGRQLGRPAGLVAALILPLSILWMDKVPSAEIDMLHVAWVTGAVLCFLCALEAEEADAVQPPSGRWWLLALLCVAAGFLTKWAAPAFFYGTVLPLLWWRGRLGLLLRRKHLLSAALALTICLAWVGWAIALEGWEPFFQTVRREALMRLSPAAHDRPYPWGEVLTHPWLILAASLPWSLFALRACRRDFFLLWDEGGRRLLQALHCWVWPNLLFWSVIPEHAPRHCLPLFPGLAGLAALVWIAWFSGKLPWRFPRLSARQVFVGLIAFWLVGKLVFVQAIVPERTQRRQPRAKGEQLAALVPRGETLYLFRGRGDGMEGILFYYSQGSSGGPGTPRPVRRLPSPAELPPSSAPHYCLMDPAEAAAWPATPILGLNDELGHPLLLVTLETPRPPDGQRAIGNEK